MIIAMFTGSKTNVMMTSVPLKMTLLGVSFSSPLIAKRLYNILGPRYYMQQRIILPHLSTFDPGQNVLLHESSVILF